MDTVESGPSSAASRNAPPTYAVLLTPAGRGAVASIRVEGPAALSAVAACFQPAAAGKRLGDFPLRRIVFGRWGGLGGEEVVACRLSVQRIEVHCHGGAVAAERIVADLCEQGCIALPWPDWVHQTSDDSLAAEAGLALAEARTERAASILLDQYQGALRREVVSLLEELHKSTAVELSEALENLLSRSRLGQHLVRPWRVVLAGRPNVGKSSLINALLGYQRSIVFDLPGTTRDVVTATTALEGWPVEFADTAGLRAGGDPLEAAGVELARREAAAADCLLLVFDASQRWTADEASLAAAWPAALVVHNKCDLADAGAHGRPPGLATSAETGEGLSDLITAIVARLVPVIPPAGAAVPFLPRHQHLLEQALAQAPLGDAAAVRRYLLAILQGERG